MTAPSTPTLLALVGLPFLGAAAVPVAYRLLGERTAYFAAGVAAVCLALVASLHGTHGTTGVEWVPSLGVGLRFHVDGLSLLIGYLATGIGVLILTYSGGYMHGEPSQPKYYAALLTFLGSMLGVAFVADLLGLFVFWELTSVSSFVLIGHYRDEAASQYAARKAMLITVAGGLFMLVGFVLLVVVSGQALDSATFALFTAEGTGMLQNADAMREGMAGAGLLVPILALLAVGAASKSAQVPLHIWLPNAMEAPTPVSAFLHSATMVKAGVYLVGRMRPLFVPKGAVDLGAGPWSELFVVLGLTTMTVMAMLAVAASDIKELLAYSTASHLGLIVAGFGFAGKLGAETGAFHVFNHAAFKAALFLVAGIVAHEAGTRRVDELGGLAEDLPVTAAVAVAASLGMAGVPPMNGFFSKELLFDAAYHAAEHDGGVAWLLPVVAVFGSVFTFLYSIRFLMLFFGEKPDELGEVHSPPPSMVAPPVLLGAIVVVVGLVPDLAVEAIVGDAYAAAGGTKAFEIGYPTEVTPPLLMSAATVGLGLVAYRFYDAIRDAIRSVLSVGPLTANWYYDNGVEGLTALGGRTVATVQTGLVRTYATWVVGSFATLTLAAYAAAGVSLPAAETTVYSLAGTSVEAIELAASITPAVVLLLALACVAAVAVARAPSHVAGVLALSIVGFVVAIFYILESAPDLALTQLVVETLLLIVFLLVLDRLPAFYGEESGTVLARDAVLSGIVGVTIFLTVAFSTTANPPKIASYFTRESTTVEEAGGHNIVNVVLVDYRALDTLGEISVVAMAAVSVVTLIAMRERGENS